MALPRLGRPGTGTLTPDDDERWTAAAAGTPGMVAGLAAVGVDEPAPGEVGGISSGLLTVAGSCVARYGGGRNRCGVAWDDVNWGRGSAEGLVCSRFSSLAMSSSLSTPRLRSSSASRSASATRRSSCICSCAPPMIAGGSSSALVRGRSEPPVMSAIERKKSIANLYDDETLGSHATTKMEMPCWRIARAICSGSCPSGSPFGKPSPLSPRPCGGASAMMTATLVALGRQGMSRATRIAAVTASGPSPPPVALILLRYVVISSTSPVKAYVCVTNVLSCGGWSRYATSAKRTSACSACLIFSTML
eukprot:Unigene2713_Nuclearia_a/m.8398 Unigene2713_Nuclearia_a/g.8398  ORF Unigene2713_Nuclearia_a/g.8398 Unigene2713_Nuclearia_a/m.8398 type:complete len:306 (+) Unigene2713_Nuclearia_a:413-1330(+)